MTEKSNDINDLLQITYKGIQGHMLKKHRSVPLYRLEHVFWPSRELMEQEALSVKDDIVQYDVRDNATIKTHEMSDRTPYLRQMWQGWTDMYGDFGDCTVTYFYVEPELDYDWHIDTYISTDMTAKKPILCAMNIVCTDENVPAEFHGYGEMAYTAALFNTSHLHRVDPQGKQRILARITFRDHIYEEVLSRVKKKNRTMS